MHPKFKWELTEEQKAELDELYKTKDIYPEEAFTMLLEDTLASFLPMADTRSQFKEVNDFTDKIMNEDPMWFKNNKSFYNRKK